MKLPRAPLQLVSCLCLGSVSAQELAGRSLAEWRERIEPAAEELAWTEIPWRASFWSAVVEARELERPILLWAMNGHPLGCV